MIRESSSKRIETERECALDGTNEIVLPRDYHAAHAFTSVCRQDLLQDPRSFSFPHSFRFPTVDFGTGESSRLVATQRKDKSVANSYSFGGY